MRGTGSEPLSTGTRTASGNQRWRPRSSERHIEATPRSGPTTTTYSKASPKCVLRIPSSAISATASWSSTGLYLHVNGGPSDIELKVFDTSATEMPFAGVYHGHQGIERFFREWLGTWKDYEIAHREYIDAGDAVVVVFRQSGTGRGSGVRTERDFFGVYELRQSKVVQYRMYESRQEALEAAGLRE